MGNQYEEERTPSLESVFKEFKSYHASSKADQTSMTKSQKNIITNMSLC